MPIVLTLAGCVLIAASVWSRAGRSTRARWWVGRRWNESGALCWMPGFGLVLACSGPLSGWKDPSDSTWWSTLLSILVLVGLVLALWGCLFLPLPKWFTPRWTRDERTTALESRVIGLTNRSLTNRRRKP